ncbi:sugar kinase [Clostridium estertheticum]|uniref:2-dehydro-3-deoxygluconokinase n=1 Tax=Clostridium estertheticum subsp. estertheticum TaxID=1552 RepID=A0A1J0GET1_9CLOT|nr:sugar kinase [Clostridium estertheticum]APC39775.1 2-dehydro-3-deoxygluconokinase [Clostridium estertheticum subsp. estertheticum]MBZ9614177.1 sugar kinase [Clostridium estertheticum subsp. laramiense]WAG74122.1 sugar kinase [Clostridium estertheticum]
MDVITFGESMVLFGPDSSGPLRYVQNFNKSIAGAESNVAIALAKLGHQVGWFSKLGDDEFGRYIQTTIRGEGVDVSKVIFEPGKNTGILFKERFMHSNPNVYYYRKGSAASTLRPEELDAAYIKNTKILHITGITPALSESCKKTLFKAIEIAKSNNVLVSFDPNIRLKLWNKEEAVPVLLEIAKHSDIIFPGIDEGEMLLGLTKPEDIALAFMKMGCKIVAVKLGKEGCYVTDSVNKLYVNSYICENPQDTVGAGDGFSAGFLSGMLNKLDLRACAEYANGVGAMAVLVKGDMEGYPNNEQLMAFIGKTKTIER